MAGAVGLAAASAVCFAAGSALQHRAAGRERQVRRGLQLTARLARRPSWLSGLALSGAAFLLHAAALGQGDLAVVQPVIVSGIGIAVLIRSLLARRLPTARTVIWLLATCAGLGLFLVSRPAAADHPADTPAAVVVMIAGAALTGAAVLVARRLTARSRLRGVFLAIATGTLYGLVAGDAKLLLTASSASSTWMLWPLWTLLAAGFAAVVINQSAYQSTKLWVTAPIISIGEAVVSILFGVVVFGETGHSSTPQLLGQGAGLALVVIGVVLLASGATTDDTDDTDPDDTGTDGLPHRAEPIEADSAR